jgi:hypothetical protein
MSARIARWIVAAAASAVPDPDTRARYREQWLADVDGAAELAMSPTRVAVGAAVAAVRLAARSRAESWTPPLAGVDPRTRRSVGMVQLALAAPYVWALGFWAYARIRLGLPNDVLMTVGHDPKDLMVISNPLFWPYPPVMLWLAFGGWVAAAVLAPVGAVLSVGGRGSARWLPLFGTFAAVATGVLATSEFGQALRLWLLD